MILEELKYLLDIVVKMETLTQLGGQSQNHMEKEIFKRLDDDAGTLRYRINRAIEKIEKGEEAA